MKSSKACGSDNIAPIMLKKFGDAGISFLRNQLHLAKIIPPRKTVDDALSYRPVSLSSPLANLMGTLLMPEVAIAHLNLLIIINKVSGMVIQYNPTRALHKVQDQISNGLNNKMLCSRSVVALDLCKVLETISHVQLLKEIIH